VGGEFGAGTGERVYHVGGRPVGQGRSVREAADEFGVVAGFVDQVHGVAGLDAQLHRGGLTSHAAEVTGCAPTGVAALEECSKQDDVHKGAAP
jgi:hypothetical protein